MYALFTDVPEHISNLAAWCGERWEEEFDEGGHLPPHINPEQSVRMRETAPGVYSLVIEGHRCALWADAFGPLMEALRDGGFEPAVYETSDPTLKWWETKMGQARSIVERASSEAQAQAQFGAKELKEWRYARAYLRERGWIVD